MNWEALGVFDSLPGCNFYIEYLVVQVEITISAIFWLS